MGPTGPIDLFEIDYMPGFSIPIVNSDNCPSADVGASSSEGASNIIEVARKNRYKLELLEPFGTFSNGIIAYLKKCTRPTIEYERITIHNSGSIIHRPGKLLWKPVTFTFYELAGTVSSTINKTAELIYNWRSLSMVDSATGLHKPPSVYMKTVRLSMLDGDGLAIWKYVLYDCWPSNVDPADLSYNDSEIADISVTLQYSRAVEGKDA